MLNSKIKHNSLIFSILLFPMILLFCLLLMLILQDKLFHKILLGSFSKCYQLFFPQTLLIRSNYQSQRVFALHWLSIFSLFCKRRKDAIPSFILFPVSIFTRLDTNCNWPASILWNVNSKYFGLSWSQTRPDIKNMYILSSNIGHLYFIKVAKFLFNQSSKLNIDFTQERDQLIMRKDSNLFNGAFTLKLAKKIIFIN